MKKWIVAISIILVTVFLFLNFALPIPRKITVDKNTGAAGPAVYRIIADQRAWDSLFPGKFTITKKLFNSVHINAVIDHQNVSGSILLIPLANDITLMHWESAVPAHHSFIRIPGYLAAKKFRQMIQSALEQAGAFSANSVNTYGMSIIQKSTTDTLLVTTKFKTGHYPSNQEIYAYIDTLKSFAGSKNAKVTGYPMLNISSTDSTAYQCTVGLPVDRVLETGNNSPILFVRMVPGRFLTADVKGGPRTIEHAHEMMQQYFQDYKRTAMAIPFDYLVTDRIAETDTAKWVTKVYAPVY